MAYADVSIASTEVVNPVFGAATNFYFDSWLSGSAGTNDQSSRLSDSATAALGNAASQTALAPDATGANAAKPATATGFLSSVPTPVLWIGGGVLAIGALAAVWYFARK